MKGGWVYIMTNRPDGTLYIGVTADLVRRVHQHRIGEGGAFTRRHRLTRLVWFEFHDEIGDAIARESTLKNWHRAWKVRLIKRANWAWTDLYPTLL